MTKSNNYEKGRLKLKAIGESAEQAIDQLSRVSPDLARYAIEFTCGDVYSRPGLDAKNREMVAVAALTVLGNAIPQLKLHIEGALRCGCSQIEIEEVIIQMSIYAGFPAAFNSMAAANEVFQKFEA